MFIKLFADVGLIAILVIAAVAGLRWAVTKKPKLRLLVPYILMAGLTSLVVGKLASLLPLHETRPFILQGVEAGASYINNPGFPSDHALLATVVVMAVYFVTPYKKLSYGLFALVILMCIARVLALVHTPLDIIGGVGAGLVGTLWYDKHKHDIKQNP